MYRSSNEKSQKNKGAPIQRLDTQKYFGVLGTSNDRPTLFKRMVVEPERGLGMKRRVGMEPERGLRIERNR